MPASPVDIVSLPYGRLKARNPSVDVAYLEEIRALYRGGKYLLRNPKVFDRLFPRYGGESDTSHEERKRRAFYVNHFSTLVDFMVAGLNQDPARLCEPGDDQLTGEIKDERMRAFAADVSPPGGKKMKFHKLLAEQARQGLLFKDWWTLLDGPDMGLDYAPANLADQERDGALDVWTVPLDTLSVFDWQITGGELRWVITGCSERPRENPGDERKKNREEYRLYTATGWGLYVVEWDDGKAAPDDRQMITPKIGTHGFRRVPVVPGCFTDGMWMGNKLHSLAVEYLNQSCGLSWAGYKALYSQLYEFLRPSTPGLDEPIDEQAANPNRAASSNRGPGIVQVRSQDDKAMYIGPDTSSFAHGLAVLDRLKADMHSVTYQMALGADTKGAVIKRAADSKEKDGEASVVVLVAVGEELRDHGATVGTAVARVRSPRPGAESGAAEEWKVGGMEKFEVADLTEQINQAVMVEGISIPSATYQKKRKARLARADLGAEATTEVMSDIEDELEQAITQDQFTMAPMALPGPAADPAADPLGDPADPADVGAVEDPPAPPPPAKKKPVGKR